LVAVKFFVVSAVRKIPGKILAPGPMFVKISAHPDYETPPVALSRVAYGSVSCGTTGFTFTRTQRIPQHHTYEQ